MKTSKNPKQNKSNANSALSKTIMDFNKFVFIYCVCSCRETWFNICYAEYQDLMQNYDTFDSVVHGHIIYDKGDNSEL